ncbi:MAG: hypothetical protein QNI99_22055 [Woeseiaceae bacterium]|nr:hypothetical protein [Woeseiaceae bacterium]
MILLVVPVFVSACAVESAPATNSSWDVAFRQAADEPTPASWARPEKWTFEIRGPEGEDLGLISLEFTDEPVDSCTTETALRARFIDSTTSIAPLEVWYGGEDAVTYPAYEITGATVFLTLNANICDANYNLAGTLSDSGAEGTVRGEGLAGLDEIGTFEARHYEGSGR